MMGMQRGECNQPVIYTFTCNQIQAITSLLVISAGAKLPISEE